MPPTTRQPDPVETLQKTHPKKCIPESQLFKHIHRGDRIFVHTACGEPQHLIKAMTDYVESNPQALFDTEVMHIWTLGVAPYTDVKYRRNFRHNSFFIGENTRTAINAGMADYTPIFLSKIPQLFQRKVIPIDVALIQTSPPDEYGYVSLGVSVDIVKSAVENASLIIAQINRHMPRVHGDGFIHIDRIDFILPYDEPLLEYSEASESDVVLKIGQYVARLIEDGDTIQVGYGSIPNAILHNLSEKKDLGVHTELISDGLVDLMKKGVITNTKKTVNRGKTVATFCMGSRDTYRYLHNNPMIEFRTVDYTNNPLIIARQDNMVAINSALEIDLTGQATAESLGSKFYSGIGGQADFMRGAILARNGKTILALPSTTENGAISRIVPFLPEGAGVTLNRGDIHYVVTEWGIAYLHGKNIRERAMELIGIAHPSHRQELILEAKKRNLIYSDQAFIPGKRGQYPEDLETYRTTRTNLEILLRPVKISDEPLLKDFFYSLSDRSLYRRFISARKDIPHERLQDFVVIDYTIETVILATRTLRGREELVGVGQYRIIEGTHHGDVAFVVRDDHQNRGIGKELLAYLTLLAKKQGLLGFSAEVLMDNRAMLRLFESMGFDIERRGSDGVYELKMQFRNIIL